MPQPARKSFGSQMRRHIPGHAHTFRDDARAIARDSRDSGLSRGEAVSALLHPHPYDTPARIYRAVLHAYRGA